MLPKLTDAVDFINWRRRVKKNLKQNDIEFLGLTDLTDPAGNTQKRHWLRDNTRENSAIIFVLADGTLTQVSSFVNEDNNNAIGF